jgi:hypothetical protein
LGDRSPKGGAEFWFICGPSTLILGRGSRRNANQLRRFLISAYHTGTVGFRQGGYAEQVRNSDAPYLPQAATIIITLHAVKSLHLLYSIQYRYRSGTLLFSSKIFWSSFHLFFCFFFSPSRQANLILFFCHPGLFPFRPMSQMTPRDW